MGWHPQVDFSLIGGFAVWWFGTGFPLTQQSTPPSKAYPNKCPMMCVFSRNFRGTKGSPPQAALSIGLFKMNGSTIPIQQPPFGLSLVLASQFACCCSLWNSRLRPLGWGGWEELLMGRLARLRVSGWRVGLGGFEVRPSTLYKNQCFKSPSQSKPQTPHASSTMI